MPRAPHPVCERIRHLYASALIATALAMVASPPGQANPVPSDTFGVNFWVYPQSSPDLMPGARAGLGVARKEIIDGVDDPDALVTLAAEAHLTLYPMLGLQASHGAYDDARAMALYVATFAGRYGRLGTFWLEHPELPYLPVRSFEIGNEPDIPLLHVEDGTSLHYTNPDQYAHVYEAARSALHAVDPGAKAIVGGLADFGSVTLTQAEAYLADIHPVDAVGYHPYRYSLRAMERHTLALRHWMDTHGDAKTPIDVNEVGASGQFVTSTRWGLTVAGYTQWAACTPSLRVEDVQPFWWGDITLAAPDPWLSLYDPQGGLTPYGAAYLGEVRTLTERGCPRSDAARKLSVRPSLLPKS